MPLIIKDEYPEELFRKDGKRLDGRDIDELRPIKMEVGVIKNADGGTRCACTTAAALALADAGIPMKSLVTAIAVGKIDGKKVVDLSGIEDKAGEADLPIAITWFNEEISLLQFDGDMDLDDMNHFLDKAKEALSKVHQIQLETLKSKYIPLQGEITNEKKGEK